MGFSRKSFQIEVETVFQSNKTNVFQLQQFSLIKPDEKFYCLNFGQLQVLKIMDKSNNFLLDECILTYAGLNVLYQKCSGLKSISGQRYEVTLVIHALIRLEVKAWTKPHQIVRTNSSNGFLDLEIMPKLSCYNSITSVVHQEFNSHAGQALGQVLESQPSCKKIGDRCFA